MPRSNGFAGSIAGAVLEAPSEELKIKPTEIPESVPMMFVVSGKSQEAPVPEQLSRLLSGCGRLSLPFNLLYQLCWSRTLPIQICLRCDQHARPHRST